MRGLQRLDMRVEEAQHWLRLLDVPEFALVEKMRFIAPQPQDDVQRLPRHVTVLAGQAIDLEHRPVRWGARGGNSENESPAGDVIEHRHPVRQFGWMMVG